MPLMVRVCCLGAIWTASAFPQFREHVVAGDLKGAYQVVAADVNRDGRADLIGLGQHAGELVWFENPSWQRRVMARGLSGWINLDLYDPGGSAAPVIVLAAAFSMEPAKSAGSVHVLQPGEDPGEPWEMREIDRLPTSHRIRFADFDGSGKKVAVNAPLAGANAASPDYRDKTPLVYYRPGVWKRELISDDFDGVLHGIAIVDWDGDGRDEILTASFQGIHVLKFGKDGKWARTRIGAGDPGRRPRAGIASCAPSSPGTATRSRCIARKPGAGSERSSTTRWTAGTR